MSFYTENFGSYSNYLTWNDGRTGREYMVKLTNEDTSETYLCLGNPSGLENFGLILERHEELHGVYESASLKLSFGKKTNEGGEFIKSAYDSRGIRANVLCDIYKKNPDTNDFEIRYNYKILFVGNSYKDSEFFIYVNLKQVGIVQTVMSNLDTFVDIESNVAINGATVTDVTPNIITIPEVNIYLYGEAIGGADWVITDEIYSGSGVDNRYFGGADEGIDLTFGRINFQTPTNGQIYVNDTAEEKDIKFATSFNYRMYGIKYDSDSLQLNVSYFTHAAGGAVLSEDKLVEFIITSDGSFDNTETVDFEGFYRTIPVNGYAVLKTYVTYVASGRTEIVEAYITDTIDNRIDERSNSIGTTTATMYQYGEAMTKAFRLITGINDSFYADWGGTGLGVNYLTSGWKIRNFTDKGVTLNLKELFLSGDFLGAIGLGYDSSTNRFYASRYSDFYQDTQVVDFGTVTNFESYPSDNYYGTILTGGAEDGKYEEEQGVREFNIQAIHGTTFEVATKLNIRCPYIIDSLNIEYTRRQQVTLSGITDTKKDESIFMFHSNGVIVYTNVDSPEGFEEVSEYMNMFYNYRELIKRLGGRLGMFWKDTDEAIRFRSNKKDINITYGSVDIVNLNDDVHQDELRTPVFFPEVQSFEANVSLDQIDALRTNPHGYYKCTDQLGVVHYGYFTNFDLQDLKNKAKVLGLTANINR